MTMPDDRPVTSGTPAPDDVPEEPIAPADGETGDTPQKPVEQVGAADGVETSDPPLGDAQPLGDAEDEAAWIPAPQDPPLTPRETLTERAVRVSTAGVTPVNPYPHKVPLLARFERFVDAPKTRAYVSPVESLSQTAPPDRLIGWLTTLVVTAIAAVIRLVNLGYPTTIMFDEVYYAKDGQSTLMLGYEGEWVGVSDDISAAFAQGDFSALTKNAEWAVHPPVGKWCIALGQWLFGPGAYGWRFGALIFGTLLVFMTIRLGRRLSRSTLIGGLAGLLVAVDGLSFLMSRIALVDIFQAFFLVAAVSAVVADRDYFRNRLADTLRTLPGQTLAGRAGPVVFRPWLIVAGVMFGLACGTKWNSLFALAVFGVVVVVWSITARRLAGARGAAWWALLSDGIPAFIWMVVVAVATYLASFIRWLQTAPGRVNNWGSADPDSWVTRHLGDAWGQLWAWHVATYNFHTGKGMQEAEHVYASNPWGWVMQTRTTGVFAVNGIQPGDQGCTAPDGSTCLQVITALGTPLLWWAAAIALVAALVWWLAGMDWRFGVVVLATCSTWLPWVFSARGAKFSFYAVTMIPFMAIGLAMALGVILGPARRGPRRQSGAVIVGVLVALIIADFAFMYPILTAQMLTYDQYRWRIWWPGWV